MQAQSVVAQLRDAAESKTGHAHVGVTPTCAERTDTPDGAEGSRSVDVENEEQLAMLQGPPLLISTPLYDLTTILPCYDHRHLESEEQLDPLP